MNHKECMALVRKARGGDAAAQECRAEIQRAARRADAFLYHAKRTGRNRISMGPSDPPSVP